MTREVQLEVLEKFEANNVKPGPVFTEAMFMIACQHAKLDDDAGMETFLDLINAFDSANDSTLSLTHPKLSLLSFTEEEKATLCLKVLVMNKLVPLVGKGERGSKIVASLCARVLEMVTEAEKSGELSLVFKGLARQLQTLCQAFLEMLNPGATITHLKQIMETVSSTREKSSYKFVLKKALEQNADYKKKITAAMSAALNEASCLPSIQAAVKSLKELQSAADEANIVEKLRPIAKEIVQWRTLLRGGATREVESLVVGTCEALLDRDPGAFVHELNNIITTLESVPAIENTALPITPAWCDTVKKTLHERSQASACASLTASMEGALQCWKNSESITKENWGELTDLLQKCMASKGIAGNALAAARAYLAAFAKEVSVLLLNPADGDGAVGTETMLTCACQSLLAACEAFDGEDKVLVKEVHTIASVFWELTRAMFSADDESVKAFFLNDCPGGKETSLLLQRLLEAKNAKATHKHANMFLASLKPILTKSQSGLESLKEVCKSHYLSEMATLSEKLERVVTERAAWKENVMTENTSWKLVLKAGKDIMSADGNKKTVEIFQQASRLAKALRSNC